jgi:hypothetical protein
LHGRALPIGFVEFAIELNRVLRTSRLQGLHRSGSRKHPNNNRGARKHAMNNLFHAVYSDCNAQEFLELAHLILRKAKPDCSASCTVRDESRVRSVEMRVSQR